MTNWKAKLPVDLPDCKLLQTLAEKAESESGLQFDCLQQLNAFRERVAGEVKYTALTFPEFTPHDEQHHLTRLFHFADRFLGSDMLTAFNVAELLLLAVGLYGHDWGMAVSREERECIFNNDVEDTADIWDMDRQMWVQFAAQRGMQPDEHEKYANVPNEVWQEYVRQTHAFRSGYRVHKYFEESDGGVADAGQRLCEGHWLDIEQLEDHARFGTDFPIFGHTVNLRALAIYVRLIDLLDIGEDRTPYVIWKFVAPRDPQSKLEWAKHRALRPVGVPNDRQYLVVEGSTGDHEVFAALEDLRTYCQHQFHDSKATLARMHDSTHRLDMADIHWNVSAIGFQPILIQFEFNRDRMFDILANEIYEGDRYVFLRELLQNAIDAIRLRRELILRKGDDPGSVGNIQIEVTHGQNGDTVVSVKDDGIGMDEHVVRDYLATAGKSYYDSEEFKRQGLGVDVIAQFGIGILTCFMSADRIEIDTWRDPQLSPGVSPLRVKIPAFRRHFRVESLAPGSIGVGTTVKVFVEGGRNRFNVQSKPAGTATRLNVTDYIRSIAGFVEFPITVTEDGIATTIVHPDKADPSTHSLSSEYPEELLGPQQQLNEIKPCYEIQHFDLRAELQIADVEGWLSYPVPHDDCEVCCDHSGVRIIRTHDSHEVIRFKEWRFDVDRVAQRQKPISASAATAEYGAVYREGILVPKYEYDPVSEVKDISQYQYSKVRPPCRLVVNLKKSIASAMNVARSKVKADGNWRAIIRKAHVQKCLHSLLDGFSELSERERLRQLSRTIVYHGVTGWEAWEIIPHELWPLARIGPNGMLEYVSWNHIKNDELYRIPTLLTEPSSEMLHCEFISDTGRQSVTGWSGDPCWMITDVLQGFPLIAATTKLWNQPLVSNRCLSHIRFLKAPWGDWPPIYQEVWSRNHADNELPGQTELLDKAIDSCRELTVRDVLRLRQNLPLPFDIVNFAVPFEELFAYGTLALNLSHPITRQFIRAVAVAERLGRNEAEGKALSDAVHNLIRHGSKTPQVRDVVVYEQWIDELRDIWDALGAASSIENDGVPVLDEFVPGTAVQTEGELAKVRIDFKKMPASDDIPPFGQQINVCPH